MSTRTTLSLCLLILLLGANPISRAQHTERVGAVEPNAECDRVVVSGDGRFAAFSSLATNLVPGDTNGVDDIFVVDRMTMATTRVSVDSSGTQADAFSASPDITPDGRYVVFDSKAANLVAGDTNGWLDIFRHDRLTGTTVRVSLDSSGNQANDSSFEPAISDDGRWIAFVSRATNLVAGDTNVNVDVFLRDMLTGTTTRVNPAFGGGESNGTVWEPDLSGNGDVVVFSSDATNLVASDTNSFHDSFAYRVSTGTMSLVTVDSAGNQGAAPQGDARLSTDGDLIVFESFHAYTPDDTNGLKDVFLHTLSTGTTVRLSVDGSGNQATTGDSGDPDISADGTRVVFETYADELMPGDTNLERDVILLDLAAGTRRLMSVNDDGTQGDGDSDDPRISADGRHVGFESNATTLVDPDTNRETEIISHSPYLTFSPSVRVANVGDPVSLHVWGGTPGQRALLYLTDGAGNLILRIGVAKFDGTGVITRDFTAPNGSTGVFHFLAIGATPIGSEVTNEPSVEIL